MANSPVPFKQADVTRALKGAEAAGWADRVREVIATPEGVRLIFGNGGGQTKGTSWGRHP